MQQKHGTRALLIGKSGFQKVSFICHDKSVESDETFAIVVDGVLHTRWRIDQVEEALAAFLRMTERPKPPVAQPPTQLGSKPCLVYGGNSIPA